MRILLTGATGFIGAGLCERLRLDDKYNLVAAIRSQLSFKKGVSSVVVSDLDGNTQWKHALQGVEVVVHASARVHVMNDSVFDPLTEFRRVNVDGTLNLARQAFKAGVRRFVFISSIKVNGEETSLGKPYTADDILTWSN